MYFWSLSLLMELGIRTWVLEGMLEVQVLGLRGALASTWQLVGRRRVAGRRERAPEIACSCIKVIISGRGFFVLGGGWFVGVFFFYICNEYLPFFLALGYLRVFF